MQYLFHLESPIGPLTLTEEDGALIRLDFGKQGQAWPETTLLAEAKKQLEQYFSGTLRSFTLPLRPEGTPFQQKVWAALLQIPWGETRTYGQVAAMIGQPKACRAVGMANNRNPLPIFIPCHWVIGANGQLTGYAGGLSAKEHLLSLEQGGR